MKNSTLSVLTGSLAALFVALSLPVAAQTTSFAQARTNIYNYLQLLRSDSNSEKVRRINQIMKLDEADAKKFWPIYREYEGELDKMAASSAEFIADFIRYHEDAGVSAAVANERARSLSERWFKAQRSRLALLEQYHDKIEKALSPVHAAQFAQIEHQIALFVDVTISGELPIVGK